MIPRSLTGRRTPAPACGGDQQGPDSVAVAVPVAIVAVVAAPVVAVAVLAAVVIIGRVLIGGLVGGVVISGLIGGVLFRWLLGHDHLHLGVDRYLAAAVLAEDQPGVAVVVLEGDP